MAADGCGRCGVATVPGARYCHGCGARLGVEIVELDVFGQNLSRGALVEPTGSPPSRLSVLAGLLVVLALVGFGLFVVGWDSDGEDVADPLVGDELSDGGSDESGVDEAVAEVVESSELDSVLSVVDDDPLIWEAGPELDGAWPIGVVEHNGDSLLFASTEIPFYGPPSGGLVLWRYEADETWTSLGTVLDPSNKVTAVTSTTDSIVAVGRGAAGEPSVWTSDDGIEWARQALPLDGIGQTVLPTHVVATETVTVIVGAPSIGESYSTLAKAVEEHTGLPRGQVGFDLGPSSPAVTITGPFGITLLEMNISELGLSDAEFAQVSSPNGSFESVVWSSVDGTGWQTTSLSAEWLGGIASTSEGEFLVAGSGRGGNRLWQSSNGTEWDSSPGPSMGSLSRWQDKFIGARGDGTGYLAVSAAGTDWVSIPLPDVLPSGRDWWPNLVTADENGIAAAVQGWLRSTEERRPTTAVFIKNGYELVAADGHQLTLRADGEELVKLRPGASLGQGGYEPDLATATVTILDHDTGERYVEFTLDELRQLELMVNDGEFYPDHNVLILHSVDAETWRISALSELGGQTGPFQNIGMLQMANDQLFAAVATHDEGAPMVFSDATVQVFTAPLP